MTTAAVAAGAAVVAGAVPSPGPVGRVVVGAGAVVVGPSPLPGRVTVAVAVALTALWVTVICRPVGPPAVAV